ncbi:hypothetical protein H2508_01955 [Parahaliea sp. F7430]|uniref:Uncharacterized protein n=1 Tax=Sediminihaliea albiluteola TaxID=2758564 RepID=A0A7W2TTX3_9GAMM|nr:hypothetical protein [Sediminihaliea albiluteola]MBA6411872.1 hypothetical protein [Sediminihaliea albiluteola]
MHTFKLLFQGQIAKSYDPVAVRQRFAKLMGIRDAARLEYYFSGQKIILFSGLDRKSAAERYQQFQQLGLVVELLRSQDQADAPALSAKHARNKSPSKARSKTSAQLAVPNFYALVPFRNSATARNRPAQAQSSKRRWLLLCAASALALIATVIAGSLSTPTTVPTGPLSFTANSMGELLLLTEDSVLRHNHAGIGSERIALQELGFSTARGVFASGDQERYFLLGNTVSEEAEDQGAALALCALKSRLCEAFGPQSALPEAVTTHPDSGVVFQAFSEQGLVRKLGPDGAILATAKQPLITAPTLVLHQGLLYTQSREGPALSVLRYEDQALAEQLDQVLLLAPPALEAGRENILSFAKLGEFWWVILSEPEGGDRGLYLFDSRWAFVRELQFEGNFRPEQLLVWGQKLLVLDPSQSDLARFNSQGQAEVALTSNLFLELIEERQKQQRWQNFWQQGLSTLLATLFLCAAAMVYLQSLRQHVFKDWNIQGAEPLDAVAGDIEWLKHKPERQARLRRWANRYLASSCSCALLLAGLVMPSAAQLTALVLFLTGPALALEVYIRKAKGHIGLLAKQLILVDHRGIYHHADSERIRYRNWFLMIDDVLIFAGPSCLPGFDLEQLKSRVVPLSRFGRRADRSTVLTLLLETRHPLAVGAGLITVTTIAALLVLL